MTRYDIKENEYGDRVKTVSVDIQMAIYPLAPGDGAAKPYVFIPAWPIDPNAPQVDDDEEWYEEE